MSAELLDIVDEYDVPTGRFTTKQEAHENGHIHRVAAVLVFLENGNLLVQPHKKFERRLDHSVGGHVRPGESYLEAAERETLEEVGLTVLLREIDVVKPGLKHYEKYDPKIRHIYGVFAAEAPVGWQFSQQEPAVDQMLEMPVPEVVELANDEPYRVLAGLMVSLGAYLRVTGSPLRIMAYGKDWGEL